ncbi:MAG: hypothetical protein AB2705_21460 [Candidatus Thiodiazotropha sp.]
MIAAPVVILRRAEVALLPQRMRRSLADHPAPGSQALLSGECDACWPAPGLFRALKCRFPSPLW